jgi:hypothetical protein
MSDELERAEATAIAEFSRAAVIAIKAMPETDHIAKGVMYRGLAVAFGTLIEEDVPEHLRGAVIDDLRLWIAGAAVVSAKERAKQNTDG